MTRKFHGYQNFWPSDHDLEVWHTLKNFNLGHSFLTRRGRASYFTCAFLTARPSMLYHDFWRWRLKVDLLNKKCPGLWLLYQRGYLLLIFSFGCRWRAMLSFWQLWLYISVILRLASRGYPISITALASHGFESRTTWYEKKRTLPLNNLCSWKRWISKIWCK